MLGGLGGAVFGASAIRTDWIEASEEANVSFFDEAEPGETFRSTAIRMVDALKSQRDKVGARLARLDALVAA